MAPVTSPDESLAAYRRRLDGVAYMTYALMTLFVPLKLWCRRRAGGWANIGLDDYMTVLALFIANGFFWSCMVGMRPMLGRHVTDLENPLSIIDFLKGIWVAQIFYTMSIANIKFVVLAFYWRLFSVKMRMTIWVMAGACIAWFVAIMMCVIFNCVPVQAAWDITILDKKCIEVRSIYLGGSVPNVILDIIIVFMPMPYVWRLHAPLGQRLVLAGMFVLGTFIAVVSLVRLIIFLNIPISTSGDLTYNFREVIVWSIVEVNIGLVCACLPSMKPAFAFIGLSGLFSSGNSRDTGSKEPKLSNSYPSYGYGDSSGSKSRPRKKGSTGGMFSTIGGLTRLDSEEELKIVDANHGTSHTEIEMTPVGPLDRENASTRTPEGICVQKEYSVFTDRR